ncbi:MAG: PAS domain S-box protein [Flavobacteriales bacterium]|nr:PAS domain S-box protein [Flavobacteriales bacterium]
MDFFKEIIKIWKFYRSDITDKEQRTILRVRLYNILGSILTITLTLLTFNNISALNVIFSIVILASCLLQLTFSYFEWYKKVAEKVLYCSYFLYSGYVLTDAFYKNFSIESTFAYIIAIYAIVMVIINTKRVLFFILFNFILSTLYILMAAETEISKPLLFGFFIVFNALAIIVIRGKNETEKKLIDRKNFLKALFNQSYDAFFLVNFYSKEIVDCNTVAITLFEAKSKEDLVGQKRDKFKVKPFTGEELGEIRNSLQQKGSWASEEEYETVNGRKFPASIVITTLEVSKSNYYVVRITDITEAKQSAEKLRQSEAKYKNLFERNLAGVYKVRTSDKMLLDCNDAFAKILGYASKNEILGEVCSDLYLESSDNNQFHELIKAKGQMMNHESRITLKGGSVIWAIENTTTVNDTDEPDYVEGTMIDITELKEQKIALKQSEERFKQLSNLAIEGILFTENGKVVDVNEQYLRILEYDSLDEIIGKDLFDFVSEESEEFVKNYLSKGGKENYLGIGKKKDGSNIFLETRGQYIQFGEKKIRASVINDVDYKIKKEQELYESEQRFKLLAEASQEGIVIHDNGVILEVNDLICKMIGYKKEEMLGKLTYDFVIEQDKDIAKKKVEEGNTDPYQVTALRKDGTKFSGEVQAREIPYQGHKVRVAAIRDITRRVEAEKELEKSRQRFKEIVEKSPDGMIIHKGSKVLFANDSALKIMGIESFEDFISQPYTNFIDEKYHAKAKKRMQRAEAGETLDFEPITLKRTDGTTIEIESKPQLMNIGSQEVILVVLHDISERVQLEKEQARAEVAEETNKRLNKEIQERIKVEEQLSATQQYTKNIIDSSLDVICATNEKGIVTEFNKAAQRTFGYLKKEVIGKHVSMLYADKNERDRTVNLLSGGEAGTFTGEVLNRRKNGEEFISYLAASTLKDKSGKTIGLMGVSRDITEVKRAQNLLEKSEEQYRDLFENATDLIQSVDSQGKILFVNESWKKTLGYSEKELENKNIFDIIAPADKPHCLEIFGKTFKGETFNTIEVVFITKEGREIIAEGNVSAKFEKGEPVSTRGIFRDVTASRLARQALIDKELQLSAIINNTDDYILSIDKNYNIIEFNNAAKKLSKTKYKKEICSGMSIFEIVEPGWVDAFTEIYKKVLRGEPQSQVFASESSNIVQHFETFYNPIRNKEDKITGIAIFSQDITERKVNEQEIKFALNEKEILLKEVHHRVKNNLQVISSILNLQSSYIEDEKTLKILSESQNRIKSMSFIHEILYQTNDFSSIDFKEYILNLSNNLIHSYQIYSNLVDLKMDVDKVLLNLDQAIPCGLIVNELFSNALKYAFDPKQAGRISISLKENNKNWLKLTVADNGKGLPNNFDYKKTESLGLQLVNTLVEQIDGTINCETSKEKGTKFIIEFKKL